MAGAEPRSILIVEELAHLPNGHFPVRCAQLATAYAELGHRVELLTSKGWSRDGEVAQPLFTLRRYRPLARALRRRATEWRGHRAALATLLLAYVLVREAEACARRMVPEPDAIIVLAWDTDPALVPLAASPRRWLVNQFRSPDIMPRIRRPAARRLIRAWGRRAEARRRATGGCVRLAVDNEARRAAWHDDVAHLDPMVAPVVGVRNAERLPDARARLGLPATGKLALLFGEPALKQRDVVLDAFEALDDWTLVVGGPIADGLDGRHRFPGVVDDTTRDLLYSAVDLVVLSFRPDYQNDSGTLMDAISFGVPVVCSDDAAVAAIVTQFRLGTRFANSNAAALADAVRQAPARIAAPDLAAARQALSNCAVARRQLLVLGILTPPT
jgi:glycosyltransferase involved in cell wall biosynthesis